MAQNADRLSSGIDGLDTVLRGGFVPGRSYMVNGPAGAGKTILALHFLTAGDATPLFINVEEDLADLRANAAALGFDTEGVEFLDLSPDADVFTEDQSYEVFSAAEVELAPVAERIVEAVEEVAPDRVVIDPLTQFRYLTADDYQFRKQVVGLMRYLTEGGATVLFTVQDTEALPTDDLQFISDGATVLEVAGRERLLRVPKFRGSGVLGGEHAFRITDEGMRVFPALDPGRHEAAFQIETVSSGVPAVDELLKGGIDRGTVTLLSGPTGVGKTTLGTQFMKEAAGRGERSVVYLFEETRETFLARSTAVNVPVREMLDRGTLRVVEVDALDQSPQEFAATVREDVERRDAEIVMLDGIAGYRLTLQGDDDALLPRLHALGRYLKGMGVTTLFVEETADVVGTFTATESRTSYLADTIVFLRHLELDGELRKAVGVLKKRTGDYERTVREFAITGNGIKVGDPLSGMRGILTGTPERVDGGED